jgi:CheY-like chemotaxis protein
MNLNWGKINIAIVEDDKINYYLINRILKKTQAQTHWLQNGQQIVDFINQNNNPDLILMDVRMPIMDGIRATKILKKSHPHIPIIIQTACVIGSDFDDIEASGCDDYLFKPIISEQLFEKIYSQISSKL